MDLIERLRQYPSGARRMIAGAASGVFTFLVAVMWMTGLSSSGALALNTPTGVDAPAEPNTANTGMAAIVESFTQQLNGESSINIVEATTSSTIEEEIVPLEATVIPFLTSATENTHKTPGFVGVLLWQTRPRCDIISG
jgi:hypothetical protein